MFSTTSLLALAGTVSAGTILWDGRLNGQTSSAFLNDWSFSNAVGPYQYYIHGSGPVAKYVNLGTDYKNPSDSGSKQGIQITIDSTSVWNSDNMLRTELIPQTKAAINKGKVYYHFSMQHTGTNPPSPYEEHQVCFFEGHFYWIYEVSGTDLLSTSPLSNNFTEMTYGSGGQATEDLQLQWYANGKSEWNTTFAQGVWHNIAYEIDFDGGSVTYWHSTGAEDLVKTAGPVSVSVSSNGADWHLGVLRLPSSSRRTDTGAEDWHFSGVYIESGGLNTSVSGPGGVSSGSGSSAVSETMPTTSATASSSTAPSSTSRATSAPNSAPYSSGSGATEAVGGECVIEYVYA